MKPAELAASPAAWRLRPLLKGLILIVTFAAVGYLFEEIGLKQMLDTGWIDAAVRGKGVSGEVLFLAVGGLATAVGVPRQLVCFLAGYAFDFWQGMVWGSAASMLGCLAAFGYARVIGRGFVAARFGGRIRQLDAFLGDHPLRMTLLIRLLPVGSNLLTNLVAGISSVAALPFLVGSALGYLPQSTVFVLLGSGIKLDPAASLAVSIALFLACGVLGIALYRRFRRTRPGDAVGGLFDDPA